MIHIPSGRGFQARWPTLEAAKQGVLRIHAEFPLGRVDQFDEFDRGGESRRSGRSSSSTGRRNK